MVYTTPCSKCDHRKVCGIRQKYTVCIEDMNDVLGDKDMCSNVEIILSCPNCTVTAYQEAILAYKRALQ